MAQDPFAPYVVDPFAPYVVDKPTEPAQPVSGLPPGTATGTIAAARTAIPPTIRATGRMIASHPVATKHAISAGTKLASSGLGYMLGEIPGAVIAPLLTHGATPRPSTIRKLGGRMADVGRVARTSLGRMLTAASGPTDLAGMVEPKRRDIGWMGLGLTQPTPTSADVQTAQANARRGFEAEEASKAAMRARLLQLLGIK